MAATSLSVFDSTSTAKSLATVTDALGNQSYMVSPDSSVSHYSGSVLQKSGYATPTFVFGLNGSTSKTVRLKRIILNGQASAAGNLTFQVKKNAGAYNAGTAMTVVPMDSQAAAGSAVPYSVSSTPGSTPSPVGAVYSGHLVLGVTTAAGFSPLAIEFGRDGIQSLVLRGAGESVTIDFGGNALPTGTLLDCTFLWSEDNS